MSKNPEFAIRCSNCDVLVTGKNRGHIRHSSDDVDYTVIHLVECPQCGSASLVKFTAWPEIDRSGEHYYGYSHPEVIYPAHVVTLDSFVPANVAANYLEAHRNFTDVHGYVSTALMCRRTLESICVAFGATKWGLDGKLKELKEKGIIENRLYEWSSEVLKALGNEAAHEVQGDIKRDDAKDALEFTRALIEYLYVFQAAYERFKTRRSQKTQG